MYLTLTELQERYNNKYWFGTQGSCFASEGAGTRTIQRESDYIDYYLSDKYGTSSPLFGTGADGTCNVPELIKSACADMSMGILFSNSMLVLSETQRAWGTETYQRGFNLLRQLHDAKMILTHNGTAETAESPKASGQYISVIGELITFNGTALYALDNRFIRKGSLRIYGTTAISPVVYTEGADYEAYYYGYGTAGTHYGCMRNHGTGSLAADSTVMINYEYEVTDVFKLNDFEKWANPCKEDRG